MKVTANHVADFFVLSAHEAGEPLTNLKLQKLVYYAQAWWAALNGGPLFNERIEAWVHGPVCPEVYHRFKHNQWRPIEDEVDEPESIDEDVNDHLEDVVENYGGMTGWELERLTHSEGPWLKARGDLAPDANCTREISVDEMKAYYLVLLSEANGENP
jgi:uncharacterized phage-associated protein